MGASSDAISSGRPGRRRDCPSGDRAGTRVPPARAARRQKLSSSPLGRSRAGVRRRAISCGPPSDTSAPRRSGPSWRPLPPGDRRRGALRVGVSCTRRGAVSALHAAACFFGWTFGQRVWQFVAAPSDAGTSWRQRSNESTCLKESNHASGSQRPSVTLAHDMRSRRRPGRRAARGFCHLRGW